MKKRNVSWKKIAVGIFGVVLLIIAGGMYRKISELTNQLTYLQDSTNVILSQVGGLQTNIEKTMQEEASIIEDYSITVESLDFLHKTYKVRVSVTPKEYTDKTQVSIFFGTLECPLSQGQYAYTGEIKLPLDKSFDGNITFLLSNGKKKTTEVLDDDQGLNLNLDDVLEASLEKAPTYRNGTLELDSLCDIVLSGEGQFTFESLQLVTLLDEKRINVTDLLPQLMGEDETGRSVENDRFDTTEEADRDIAETDTIESGSGTVTAAFTYKMQEEDSQTENENAEATKQHIRIFVRANTTEGYRFEYTVFEGDYLTQDKKMDKESFQWNTKNAAYDRNGNELSLAVGQQ